MMTEIVSYFQNLKLNTSDYIAALIILVCSGVLLYYHYKPLIRKWQKKEDADTDISCTDCKTIRTISVDEKERES